MQNSGNGTVQGATEERRGANKDTLVWMLMLFGLILVLGAVSGLQGAGPFSLASAMTDLHRKTSLIEIAEDGANLFMIALSGSITIAVCRLLKISPAGKYAFLPVLVCVLVGASLLDEGLGKPVITHFMTSHGYARCSSQDKVVGEGKSRVRFEAFVSNPSVCGTPSIGRTEP